MVSQSQIDAALKAGYTMEQINKETATPGSVKRKDYMSAPVYEQMVNGKFASARTTPVAPAPIAPIAPAPIAPAPVPNQPVPTPVPVEGSAGSIFGEMSEADKFMEEEMRRKREIYNTPVDEATIRKNKEAEYQKQLDATRAIYADKLNQSRIQGQGRIGSGTAMQARGGLLGSDFGAAQTNRIEDVNTQADNLVREEENLAIAGIQGLIRAGAAEEIAAKRAAIKESGEALLAHYSGAGDRKTKKTSDLAKKALALGLDPSKISDADLKAGGINRDDLTIAYNELKSVQESASAKAQAEADKSQLEMRKGEADIQKIYGDLSAKEQELYIKGREASRPFEVGGYLFDADGKAIGTKYEKPEYLKFEDKNADGSTNTYYQNPATGKKIDPIQTFGADVGYKVDLNAVMGGYSPKGQELLSVPDGTVIPTRLGQVSPQNASIRGKECAEYVNDIAGTKMGNTYASKTAICNESTGGIGSVVAWNPNGSGAYGHTGIIVSEDANNYYVKSSNYVPGTVTTEPVPKQNIKNFYTPDAVKVQRLPPVSKEILSGLEDLLSSKGLNSAVGFGFQKLNFGNQAEDGFLPGTEAENFRAKFNSFRDNMVLPNLSKLKGPMSDKDIQFLRNSATSLSLSMTEKAFKTELQKIKDKLMGISDEDIVNTY